MKQQELNEIIMQGEAEFLKMMKTIEDDYLGGPTASGMKMLWMSLPDGAKEFVRQSNPKLYDQITKLITK